MSIFLNEFVGFKFDKDSVANQKKFLQSTNLKESAADIANGFTVKIEAMHTAPDYATRNYTRYMQDGIQKSLSSWTEPYNIPVIMYHNDYDGTVVGRVLEASMAPSQKMNGSALILTASIPGYMEQENIRNGILKTVSIGASANDVRCSICGAQLSEGEFCEHERGETYDGKTCYWDVYDWEAKEVSFVIVPSDKYAGIISWNNKEKMYMSNNMSLASSTEKDKMAVSESDDKNKQTQNIDIKESLTQTKKTQEGKRLLELKEALAKIDSMETERKALIGDKKSLQESIDTLNSEKVKLQESLTDAKKKVEEAELSKQQEKDLREAAEKKVDELTKEVRASLAESYAALREKANKSAIEKLEERSIDSLRDSINDLKAELKEASQHEDAKKLEESMKDVKGSIVKDNMKIEESVKADKEPEVESAEPVLENFDL